MTLVRPGGVLIEAFNSLVLHMRLKKPVPDFCCDAHEPLCCSQIAMSDCVDGLTSSLFVFHI